MKHLFGSKNNEIIVLKYEIISKSMKVYSVKYKDFLKHKMMEGESHSLNCERNQPHLLKDGALIGLRVFCEVAGLGKRTH